MSKYVLSFRADGGRKATPDQEAAWGQWFQEIGSTIADFGSRVGQVRSLGNGGAKGGNVLAGYVVINADSIDDAVTVANGCPGLQYGGAVEVGETVEM